MRNKINLSKVYHYKNDGKLCNDGLKERRITTRKNKTKRGEIEERREDDRIVYEESRSTACLKNCN